MSDPLHDDRQPVSGRAAIFQENSHWRDNLLFYEYFHGDNGSGVSASHQTGRTALVANLIQETALIDSVRNRAAQGFLR